MKLFPATLYRPNRLASLAVVGTLSLLSACSSSDSTPATETPGDDISTQFAYIATAGVESGLVERYSVETNTLVSSYPAETTNDLTVATDGTNVYQIAKFGVDSLTKFDAVDTSLVSFQFSVNGDETNSNPYSLAFVNDTKAYITRYGSDKVWIIDPSVDAADEANFKTGELDISAYGVGAVPRVSQSVIVGDKLFLLMERLDAAFAPNDVGYVAVFDTTTDEEIDTQKGEDGLLGIKLNTLNPSAIQYLAASDEIYVTGRGNPFNEFNDVEGDPYQGGIETIDPNNYDIELLLDDGTEGEGNNNGFFLNSLVVSPTLGYVVTNTSTFRVDTLRAFNPMTGLLAVEPIAGLADTGITDIALAPDGKLWVGVPGEMPGDGSGYFQIDTTTNMIVGELMATTFSPLNVVFITVPVAP